MDLERFPLVLVTPTAEVHNDLGLDETYRQFAAVLSRQEHVYLLWDMRGGVSTPTRRRRLATWIQQHESQVVKLVVAVAVLVRTEVERGFVTAVTWLFPPFAPLKVFTHPDEAQTWLLEKAALQASV